MSHFIIFFMKNSLICYKLQEIINLSYYCINNRQYLLILQPDNQSKIIISDMPGPAKINVQNEQIFWHAVFHTTLV